MNRTRVRRRRVRATLLGVLAIVALVTHNASARDTGRGQPVGVYLVQPGDTVWEIAVTRTTGDPRELVHTILEMNGLQHRPLLAGERILVPRG